MDKFKLKDYTERLKKETNENAHKILYMWIKQDVISLNEYQELVLNLSLHSVIAMLPTDTDIEKYANGNFGYDRYSYEKEEAFKSGAEYIKDELTYKLKNNQL